MYFSEKNAKKNKFVDLLFYSIFTAFSMIPVSNMPTNFKQDTSMENIDSSLI